MTDLVVVLALEALAVAERNKDKSAEKEVLTRWNQYIMIKTPPNTRMQLTAPLRSATRLRSVPLARCGKMIREVAYECGRYFGEVERVETPPC